MHHGSRRSAAQSALVSVCDNGLTPVQSFTPVVAVSAVLLVVS